MLMRIWGPNSHPFLTINVPKVTALIPLHQPSLLTGACCGEKLEKEVVSILPRVPRGKGEYKSNCSAATRKSLSLVFEEVMVQKILEY